jgi:hypothetical protein
MHNKYSCWCHHHDRRSYKYRKLDRFFTIALLNDVIVIHLLLGWCCACALIIRLLFSRDHDIMVYYYVVHLSWFTLHNIHICLF